MGDGRPAQPIIGIVGIAAAAAAFWPASMPSLYASAMANPILYSSLSADCAIDASVSASLIDCCCGGERGAKNGGAVAVSGELALAAAFVRWT